ncbi:hypothetical protein B0H14DRAFT_2641299 [Mycena olivaceomarginata]|nr:hypothetical protein B0H14DRAFT_2641299 [Mycena olivaceomarginata]
MPRCPQNLRLECARSNRISARHVLYLHLCTTYMQSDLVLEGVIAFDRPRVGAVDNNRDGLHKVPSERSTFVKFACEMFAMSTKEINGSKKGDLATSNGLAMGNAISSICCLTSHGLLPLYLLDLVGDQNFCWIPIASFLNAVVHHISAKSLILITADERRFLGNAPAEDVESTVGQEHLISNEISSSIADLHIEKHLSTVFVHQWPDMTHRGNVLVQLVQQDLHLGIARGHLRISLRCFGHKGIQESCVFVERLSSIGEKFILGRMPPNPFHRQESRNVIASMEPFQSGHFRLFWSESPSCFHQGRALCYDFASHLKYGGRSLLDRGSDAASERTILDGCRLEATRSLTGALDSRSILWSAQELDEFLVIFASEQRESAESAWMKELSIPWHETNASFTIMMMFTSPRIEPLRPLSGYSSGAEFRIAPRSPTFSAGCLFTGKDHLRSAPVFHGTNTCVLTYGSDSMSISNSDCDPRQKCGLQAEGVSYLETLNSSSLDFTALCGHEYAHYLEGIPCNFRTFTRFGNDDARR